MLEELESAPLYLECSVEYVWWVTGTRQCCENSFKGGLKDKLGSGTSSAQGIYTSRMTVVMRGISQARASNTLSLGLLKEHLFIFHQLQCYNS